ncbi:MAG: hypothetical protein BGO43_01720 [Gammaproteobacteria bacterium 39-13]|nr:hypothetical protein [Gammaproteobacteria bacterium]OJV89716.1 MAG: hypothetical protein BGO43_01720 [Gammaproteobacteria bacterium 39-13]
MSLDSVTSSKPNLINSLKAKYKTSDKSAEEKLVYLIKKKKVELHEVDPLGQSAIHWAAMNGWALVFNALVEKGVDPFLPSGEGFSPNRYARVHKSLDILKIYEEQFPVVILSEESTATTREIDAALLDCGFHGFPILPIESPKSTKKDEEALSEEQALAHFLKQIFKDERFDFKSLKSATKSKKITLKYIDTTFLSQIAAGMVEQSSPEKVLKILNQLYPNCSWRAKLSCIYLVKEMLLQARVAELLLTDEFQQELKTFTQHRGEALALEAVKMKLAQFYQSKFHLPLAANYALDLLKVFTQATLQISPEYFSVKKMSPKLLDTPFVAFSTLYNKLTYTVCMDILMAPTIAECASRMDFYLQVIEFCLTDDDNLGLIPNFSAASAIYNALQLFAVSRLQNACIISLPSLQKALSEFDPLLKGLDNFAGINQRMAENQRCIPMMSLYSAQKDKLLEKDLASSIVAFGQLNQQFERNRSYLASLAYLQKMGYKTDFISKVHKMVYVEKDAEWYSFNLEPLRIINLDEEKISAHLLEPLKFCLTLQAPLVVKKDQVQFKGHAAKDAIEAFLATPQFLESEKPEEKRTEILGLCDKIIAAFAANNPFAAKIQEQDGRKSKRSKKLTRTPHEEVKPLPSALIDDFAALKINEKPHTYSPSADNEDMVVLEEEEKRPRANTTILLSSRHHRHQSERVSSPRKDKVRSTKTTPNLDEEALLSSRTFTPLVQAQSFSNPLMSVNNQDSSSSSPERGRESDLKTNSKAKLGKK